MCTPSIKAFEKIFIFPLPPSPATEGVAGVSLAVVHEVQPPALGSPEAWLSSPICPDCGWLSVACQLMGRWMVSSGATRDCHQLEVGPLAGHEPP